MDEKLSVQDMLAVVTAGIDQAQAMIDENRSKYKNDLAFQKQLDQDQFRLDIQRERAGLMKFIDTVIDPQ